MRIAIYARVSTTDHGQQTGMQTKDLEEFCRQRGFHLVDSYVDEGVSGSKDSRPQLDRLMKDARKRRFDAVLVWKLDRFGRSLKHLVNALAEFQALGVVIHFLQGKSGHDNPIGSPHVRSDRSDAEFERDLISERTKAGVAFARSKGKTLGRPVTVTSTKADIVRLRTQGHSLRAIGRSLGISEGSVRRLVSATA